MAEHRMVKKIGKAPLFYTLVLVVFLSLISLLQWTNSLMADTYYYFSQALAFALGIGHVFLLYRYVLQIHPDDFWKGFGFTFLLMILAAIAACLAYYYIGLDYHFLTYLFSFILPFLCWQVFRFFFQIPPAVYKPWHYPLDEEMPDLDMIDLSQIEVVQFVFSKNPQDGTQTNFTSKAPLNMTLGQLFFVFINDYNDKNALQPIGYLQPAHQPFGWLFFRKKKWFGARHFFDANLSFRENGIQPNELIYAVRVD